MVDVLEAGVLSQAFMPVFAGFLLLAQHNAAARVCLMFLEQVQQDAGCVWNKTRCHEHLGLSRTCQNAGVYGILLLAAQARLCCYNRSGFLLRRCVKIIHQQ